MLTEINYLPKQILDSIPAPFPKEMNKHKKLYHSTGELDLDKQELKEISEVMGKLNLSFTTTSLICNLQTVSESGSVKYNFIYDLDDTKTTRVRINDEYR